jgi:hypothetical protein
MTRSLPSSMIRSADMVRRVCRAPARRVIAGVLGLGLAACGPIVYVNEVSRHASDSVDTARAAHADKLAPYWWTRATQYLEKAREIAAHADFQGANRFGQLAAEAADKATAEALIAARDPSKRPLDLKPDVAPAKDPIAPARTAPAKDPIAPARTAPAPAPAKEPIAPARTAPAPVKEPRTTPRTAPAPVHPTPRIAPAKDPAADAPVPPARPTGKDDASPPAHPPAPTRPVPAKGAT